MISNSIIKKINSLKYKKYRQKHELYVVEGAKIVKELITSKQEFFKIYSTKNWINDNKELAGKFKEKTELIDESILNKLSFLKTPNQVLALVKIPAKTELPDSEALKDQALLILDSVSDPGNMGTIIRTADWYGIQTILCFNNCVDIYHPAVVQASMGSIFHLKIYQSPDPINMTYFSKRQTVAACLDGSTEWDKLLEAYPVFLIGSESHGLSENVLSQATLKATIKKFGRAESLNAAIATAIVLDRWRAR